MSYKDKLKLRAKKNNALSIVKKFSHFDVIKKIIFTEKTYNFVEDSKKDEKDVNNKYFFEIDRMATKNDVKFAVNKLYNVDVEDIKTINMPLKARSRRVARKPMKKAIIKLKKWQKIEFMK